MDLSCYKKNEILRFLQLKRFASKEIFLFVFEGDSVISWRIEIDNKERWLEHSHYTIKQHSMFLKRLNIKFFSTILCYKYKMGFLVWAIKIIKGIHKTTLIFLSKIC